MNNKPKIDIRRARQEDMDSLTVLLKVLFAIEKDFTFEETAQRQGLQLLLESASGCILVAEIDRAVVGMCTGQLTISTAEGGLSLLVEDVVVERKWRGLGIAREMLDTLAQWAAGLGVSRLQLLADRNNAAALKFYDRLGWQQTRMICLRKRQ